MGANRCVLLLWLLGKEDCTQSTRSRVVIKESVVPLVEIVVVLIVVGVLLWLVNTYIPMAGPIKSLLNAVVVIALIVWILKAFGLWQYVMHLRAGS
jgi:hypothetical protein